MPYLIDGYNIENDLCTTRSAPTTIADDGESRTSYQGLPITYSPADCVIADSLTKRYYAYGLYNIPSYARPGGFNITDGLFGLGIRYNHTGATPNTSGTLLSTSNTVTSPANCNHILVYCVGGGGGGGDTGANTPGGTGGNSGPGYNGEVNVFEIAVGPNSNFIVSVGAGGGGGNRPGGITAARGAPSFVRFPTAGSSPRSEANGGMGAPNGGDGSGIAGSGSNGSPSSASEFFPTANYPGTITAGEPPSWYPPTGQIATPGGTASFVDSPTNAIGGFGGGATNASPNSVGRAGNHGMVAIWFRHSY